MNYDIRSYAGGPLLMSQTQVAIASQNQCKPRQRNSVAECGAYDVK